MSRIACSPAGPSIAFCFGKTMPTAALRQSVGDAGSSTTPAGSDSQQKVREIDAMATVLESTYVEGISLSKYLRRPEITWNDVAARLPRLPALDREVASQVETDLKYAGYVSRQQTEIDRQSRLSEKRIPDGFRYEAISQLRAEAREKLCRVRPRNLSQASRISGITPADIALLIVHLGGKGKVPSVTQ